MPRSPALGDAPGEILLWRSAGQILDQEPRKPQDGAEDVVEVVRDAAGQSTDRFHFLRLPKLRLHGHRIGDGRAH
ncbi:MAG: hypothetical protein WDO24_21545 [Pseudomonadota bacterium]